MNGTQHVIAIVYWIKKLSSVIYEFLSSCCFVLSELPILLILTIVFMFLELHLRQSNLLTMCVCCNM